MKEESAIKKIAIAGAGTMGATIAQVFAQAGYNVVLYDISDNSLSRGHSIIETNQKNLIDSGLLTETAAEQSLSKIQFTTDLNTFKCADLVIEAVIEKIDVKHELLKKISSIVSEEAIIATNTSGLSITEIAKAVSNKKRFAGMHWWNPPHLIPLIEIIKGEETSQETADELIRIAKSLNKKPVLVKKDILGFIGNRLQYALLREALYLLEQDVATAEDIDDAMKYGLGLRYSALGPIETVDLGGVDVFNNVGSYLFAALSNCKEVPQVLRELYEQGNFGIKTGKGFFDYSDDKGEEVLKKRDKHLINMMKYILTEN